MYNTYIRIYFLFSIYYMPDTSIVLYMSHVFNPYNSPTNLILLWLFRDAKTKARVGKLVIQDHIAGKWQDWAQNSGTG